jgi:hypothetical protein
MISVDELIYEFELKLNSLDRQDNQQIQLENKLIYLNNAQDSWIKSKLNFNNIYKLGYEAFRKRIDDLQVLKVNDYKLVATKTDNTRYIGYKVNLTDISNYSFYVSAYAEVKKDNCSSTVSVDLIKEGELEDKYFNENYKPSFEWRYSLATLGDNSLYVYTSNDFDVEKVSITYLRYPKRIDKEGYVKLDGLDSVNQDCELPYYAKNDIVDLAVKYAAQSIGDQLQVQMAKEREQNNE